MNFFNKDEAVNSEQRVRFRVVRILLESFLEQNKYFKKITNNCWFSLVIAVSYTIRLGILLRAIKNLMLKIWHCAQSKNERYSRKTVFTVILY